MMWLVVSTYLKEDGQIGNLPQIGMKIINFWNHQLVIICIPGTCLFFVLGLNPPKEFIRMNAHFQRKKSEKIQCKKGNGVFTKYHALYPSVGQTWEWLWLHKERQSYSSRIGPRRSPFMHHAVDSTPFEVDELSRAQYPCLITLMFWDVALNHWIIRHNDKP